MNVTDEPDPRSHIAYTGVGQYLDRRSTLKTRSAVAMRTHAELERRGNPDDFIPFLVEKVLSHVAEDVQVELLRAMKDKPEEVRWLVLLALSSRAEG